MHEFFFDGLSDWCMRAIHIVCLFNSLAFFKLSCASAQLLKSNTQKLHTGSSSRSSNRSDWNNNTCSKRNNGDNCHAIDGTLSLHTMTSHTLTLISHFFPLADRSNYPSVFILTHLLMWQCHVNKAGVRTTKGENVITNTMQVFATLKAYHSPERERVLRRENHCRKKKDIVVLRKYCSTSHLVFISYCCVFVQMHPHHIIMLSAIHTARSSHGLSLHVDGLLCIQNAEIYDILLSRCQCNQMSM